MTYNFDKEIDRTITSDLKWNKTAVEKYLNTKIREDMIPMWIADTDFGCMPEILTAIKERAEKEVLGYCTPLAPFYKSVIFWNKANFNWDLKPEWILTAPTVVASINIAIRAFSNEGDGIIIQTPVYDPFTSIVVNSNRTVVSNQLLKDENGKYYINFAQLEEFAKDPNNKVMVLCSPHNPVGKVWSKEDLLKIGEICAKNNVVLVSDEIHSDIVFGDAKHYPMASLSDEIAQNTIHLSSAGKTFNVAGLKFSIAVIQNPELRAAFNKMQVALSLDIKNTFGIEGTTAAYSAQGLEWVKQELAYLEGNVNLVDEFVKTNMPNVTFVKPEGTFLCWLDLSKYNLTDEQILHKLLMEAGVICVPGNWFGKGGEQHLRLNIGCTRKTLKDALERINKVLG